MSITRYSEAKWTGDIKTGKGVVRLGSRSYEGAYSFKDRFSQESPLTNPEELIAAAHAGCFSMALSAKMTQAGFPPSEINTKAFVQVEKTDQGFSISSIELETEVKAELISESTFISLAESAKKNCPVSKALASVPVTLKAQLL
jgi:osmotically inducible protein OsmC